MPAKPAGLLLMQALDPPIVASDPRVIAAYTQLDGYARRSTLPVIVRGDTGTGKERIAEAYARAAGLKLAAVINCAAIPEHLFESELFGHKKGAFTGATSDRKGAFELADGAVLFLDEVGELPLAIQPKLLRALQQGEFQRVGDTVVRKVTVRLVAATNRDLATTLRADLLHRFAPPIELPPLDERDDLGVVAADLWADRWRDAGAEDEPPPLPAEVVELLERRAWPGNARQLRNVLAACLVAGSWAPIEEQTESREGGHHKRVTPAPQTGDPRTTNGCGKRALIARAQLAVAESGLSQAALARECFGGSNNSAQRFLRKPTFAAALRVLLALGWQITATPPEKEPTP